jgi:predicted O-methyltransferase YrrM
VDSAVENVLREYQARIDIERKIRAELGGEQWERRRDEWLLEVGHSTGQLLNLLAKEARAHTILEVGASRGYSTVWLAEAARAMGGKVISLENHPEKVNYARGALVKAGLADFVDFRLGDAIETIPQIMEPIDFVLLDIWKELYIPCFDLFYPKLRAGAYVAADNMISPPYFRDAAVLYQKHVRAKGGMDSILLPVGAGVELSRFVRGQ